MHDLRRVLREFREIEERLFDAAERLAEVPAYRGLLLDENPVWRFASLASRLGIDPAETRRHLPMAFGGIVLGLGADEARPNYFESYGLDQLLPKEHTLPFRAKIVGRADALEGWETLVDLATALPIPAVIEIRADASFVHTALAVSPGSGISGTLGGLLQDTRTGEVYATTAGHVTPVGNAYVNRALLGYCAYSQAPIVLPAGARCLPRCAYRTVHDFALIRLNGAASPTRTTLDDVFTHQLVTMDGAVSGTKQFEVGAHVLAYEVGGACLAGAFELRLHVQPGFLHPNFSMLSAASPRPGDSGSWVHDASQAWCGMVIAADPFIGYALPSDTLRDQANADWQLDLV